MRHRLAFVLSVALSACDSSAGDSAGEASPGAGASSAVVVEVLTHAEVFNTDAGGAIALGEVVSVHACSQGICAPVPWSTTGAVVRPEQSGDTYRFVWAVTPE